MENRFNYEKISEIYNQMRNITGTPGDTDSIAGILDSIDKDYRAAVAVEDGAIFGSLGDQLLLNWDNSSSDFPNFVNNFENWSTLIAQSADKYSEFEEKVSKVRADNPFGISSNKMQNGYIETSYYREYKNSNYDQYVADLANVKPLQAITGAEYTFTDSVSMLEKHKKITYAETGLLAVGTAIWGASLLGVGGGTTTPPAAGAGAESAASTATPPPNAASGVNGSNVIELPTANPGATPAVNPASVPAANTGTTVTNTGNVIQFPTSTAAGGTTTSATGAGSNVIQFPTSTAASGTTTSATGAGSNVIQFPTSTAAGGTTTSATGAGSNVIQFPTSTAAGGATTSATGAGSNVIQFPGQTGTESIVGIANAA